jgi:hypothetical protein
MTIRVVRNTHTASYANPIEVMKGQTVALTGREDIWDGTPVVMGGFSGWSRGMDSR